VIAVEWVLCCNKSTLPPMRPQEKLSVEKRRDPFALWPLGRSPLCYLTYIRFLSSYPSFTQPPLCFLCVLVVPQPAAVQLPGGALLPRLRGHLFCPLAGPPLLPIFLLPLVLWFTFSLRLYNSLVERCFRDCVEQLPAEDSGQDGGDVREAGAVRSS